MTVVKIAPDRDCYVDWSDIATSDWPKPGDPGFENYQGGFHYGWDDAGLVTDQRWLPRENLEAYSRLHLEGRYEEAYALTEPCDG